MLTTIICRIGGFCRIGGEYSSYKYLSNALGVVKETIALRPVSIIPKYPNHWTFWWSEKTVLTKHLYDWTFRVSTAVCLVADKILQRLHLLIGPQIRFILPPNYPQKMRLDLICPEQDYLSLDHTAAWAKPPVLRYFRFFLIYPSLL